jgi:DNA-binding transcriptional ArsR family regulator
MAGILSDDDIHFVRMCKALGNPVRFQIVEELERCQPCMCGNIVAKTVLAQSTVSQHLKVLRDAGIIRGYDAGTSVCYCLDRDGLAWFKQRVADRL